MFSKIWLINLLLAVFAIFFGIKACGVWHEGEKAGLEIKAVEKHKAQPRKRIAKMRIPPESAYEAVVEKNLFAPGRTGTMSEESESEPDVKQLMVDAKEMIVSGVIMMDNYEAALVSTLKHGIGRRRGRTNPGEWESEWVKVGDTIGDFHVTGIKEDRVIFTEGAKEYEIFLYDKDKPEKQIPVTKEAKPSLGTKGAKPRVIRVAPEKRITGPHMIVR
jgi:hypothetical protein